jgi:hypothetical protein
MGKQVGEERGWGLRGCIEGWGAEARQDVEWRWK